MMLLLDVGVEMMFACLYHQLDGVLKASVFLYFLSETPLFVFLHQQGFLDLIIPTNKVLSFFTFS